MTSKVIVISGPPASGKTTLGKKLAAELHIPFFGRDDFKELLFDNLGYHDREYSRQLGSASFALLFYCCDALFQTGVDCIVETTFHPRDIDRFEEWKKKYGTKFLQIACFADPKILIERFSARVENGERHPGHVDHLNIESYKKNLEEGHPSAQFQIGKEPISVDTTDFEKVDFESLLEKIKTFLM